MEKERYKIGICFFGLTRSLKYTLPSIQKNVFNVLTSHNMDYDVYLLHGIYFYDLLMRIDDIH